MSFSVLISVYHKENPLFMKRALESVYENQTLKPTEVLIIKDGPLTKELDRVIKDYEDNYPGVFNIITLSKNKGLGNALKIGVEKCKYELIARMDTDDIAVPDRFEKQIRFMKANPDVVLVSSDIAEFDNNPNIISGKRVVPKKHEEICKFAKKRNPMNHMAVMYRKEAVLNSGNYKIFLGYEDYYLWVRILLKGYITANINDVLVNARIGNNMLARRQGFKFYRQEIKLQQEFRDIGFINSMEFIQNVLFRALPRLLPESILSVIYKMLRK